MAESKPFAVHPAALCASESIGDGTRIWAFSNVQKLAIIGKDCNICDHCFVENNVRIGDRVTVKNGVSLWDGMTIEDDVFIGPNAVFTNDIFPRSKVYHDQVDKTLLKQGATIGANAVVVAGHTVGKWAFVGAGAVVTKNIPDYTMWYGNPAKLIGYVCRCAKRIEFTGSPQSAKCPCGLGYRLELGIVVPE
jgi:acetyltransferase-like isoleucine patch superfamily enzyme